MLNIPANLELQINQLANKAHKPIDVFLSGLIAEYVEDQLDINEADEIYRRIKSGQEETVPFIQVLNDNGLDSWAPQDGSAAIFKAG